MQGSACSPLCVPLGLDCVPPTQGTRVFRETTRLKWQPCGLRARVTGALVKWGGGSPRRAPREDGTQWAWRALDCHPRPGAREGRGRAPAACGVGHVGLSLGTPQAAGFGSPRCWGPGAEGTFCPQPLGCHPGLGPVALAEHRPARDYLAVCRQMEQAPRVWRHSCWPRDPSKLSRLCHSLEPADRWGRGEANSPSLGRRGEPVVCPLLAPRPPSRELPGATAVEGTKGPGGWEPGHAQWPSGVRAARSRAVALVGTRLESAPCWAWGCPVLLSSSQSTGQWLPVQLGLTLWRSG